MQTINSYAEKQIEEIKKECEKIKPLLVIHSLAYNHGPYIRDALEGFVKQKTDFPFVAIVHDDASTDNTAEIIREYAEKYPDIIKPIFEKENQYSKPDGSLTRIMNYGCEVTGAKYIAMCESDDYWIDPNKLQMQVDFLESNPSFLLCYTQCRRYDDKTKNNKDIWGGDATTFEELIQLNTIPTLTTVFRLDVFLNYYLSIIETERKKWMMGDYPLWLYISLKGQIGFIKQSTSVYRILLNSASHNVDKYKQLKFKQSCNEVALFFIEKKEFKNANRIREDKQGLKLQYDYLVTLLGRGKKSNNKYKMIKHAIIYPHSFIQRIKLLAFGLLPDFLIKKIFL